MEATFYSLPPLAFKIRTILEDYQIDKFTAKEMSRLSQLDKCDTQLGIFELLERRIVRVIPDSIQSGSWVWEYIRRNYGSNGSIRADI